MGLKKINENLACYLLNIGGVDIEAWLQQLEQQTGRLTEQTPAGAATGLRDRLEWLVQQWQALPCQQSAETATADAPPACDPPPPDNPSAAARRLMKIHDTLWLAQHQSGALPANGVNRMVKEIGELLQTEAIEIVNDSGLFDPSRHAIVDLAAAESPEQNDHIQQTIRPGYRWQTKTLRPQEVILYQYQAQESQPCA